MIIRDALSDDAQGIMEIYNDAVSNTTAIWNETKVDVTNRIFWISDKQRLGYPVLVAVDENNKVLGYASFGDWRSFEGYKYTVEHSVYVHKDARGSGIGRQLMIALIERAKSSGIHVMIACIEANNEASIKLHLNLGFKQTGLLPEVGTKFGKWLDLVFLQLKLNNNQPIQS